MTDRAIQRPKHALSRPPSGSPSAALSSDPDVNWTDAAAIVEKEEFGNQDLLGSAGPFNFGNLTANGTPHFDGFMSTTSTSIQQNLLSPSPLEMSWGAFFAKKSPPLDQPQFSSPNNSGDHEAEMHQPQRFLTASFVGGQDKFLQPVNASTPTTQFRNGAFHIEVPQLECIQRFYQFGVKISVMDENKGIKPQIDEIIEQYLRTQFEDPSRPMRSYVTYHRELHRCTVLLIFPSRRHSQNAGSSKTGANASKDHDLNSLILKDKTNVARNGKNADNSVGDESDMCVEWVEHFLKFPPVSRILDTSTGEPAFTEISATS